MQFLADTCFLVDLQRDRNGAMAWIQSQPDAQFWLCPTVFGEFLSGDRVVLDVLSSLQRLELDYEVAETYARFVQILRASGNLIGVNDLWIGATAIRYNVPILTRNRRDFERIPGLQVETYGEV